MARPATAAVRLLTGEREPVRLATTANITLHGLQTIDGVPAEVGDRVLVKDQADGTQNGIYTASEGTWYRAADARSSREMQKGTTVHTQIGTANADRVFSFTADEPVIGTDDITIVPFLPPDISGVVGDVEVLKDATVTAAAAAAASATTAITNAGLTAADVVATAANLASAQAARDASLYGKGIFPTTAAAIGLGVIGHGAITPGATGTDGTFDLAFTGGAGSGAAGRFVVAGGVLTQILITAPGSYTVAPTFSFAASVGLAGAGAAVVLGRNVEVGGYFWTEVSAGVLGLYNVTVGPAAADTGVRAATSALVSDVERILMIEGASVPTAKLIEAAGAGINPSLYRAAFPYVDGDILEHIVEAKAAERGTVQLLNVSVGAVYNATLNLLEGTVIASGGANLVSASAKALGGGWYEFKVTTQITANVPGSAQCRISPTSYTGDGVSGIYVRKHVMQKQGTTVNLFPSSDPTSLTFTRQNLADVINTATSEALAIPALEGTANQLDVLINGRLTATKLVEPVGSGSPSFWQPRTGLVIGDDVEIEVIAKRDERARLNLFSNSGARYDVTANLEVGSLTVNPTFPLPATASITPLGGGWYKIKINQEADVAGGMNPQHRIFSDAGGHPYVGDGVSGLHVQSSIFSVNGGPNLNVFPEDLSVLPWTRSASATAIPNDGLYLGILANPANIGGGSYDDGSAELIGKKWAALGSSITAQNRYTAPLAEQTGMVLTNFGVGGAALGASNTAYPSFGIYNAIASIPPDTELVTLEAGINDFGAQECTLGELNDTAKETSFYGALFEAVGAIRTRAPNAKIVFITPYSGGPGHATHKILRVNGQGNTLDQFMQAVRDVANLTGWPCIDVGGKSGIGYFTSALYMSDELHINAAGGLRHGTFDAEEFRRLSRRGFFGA